MASRKVGKLLQAGAEVVVVSPEVLPELAYMDVEIQHRTYEYGDLEGANLAFTATASREVNAAVAREAKERGVPINVADRPSEGDFAVPSTLRRGGLQVAVSTGGASPALAKRIKRQIADEFGESDMDVDERNAVVARVAAETDLATVRTREEAAYQALLDALDTIDPAVLAERVAFGDSVEQVVIGPEVVEAVQVSGQFDYLLKIVVPDIRAWRELSSNASASRSAFRVSAAT